MIIGVIVYGPAGCGKSRNSSLLRRKYGMRQVQDGWDGRSHLQAGVLALTNVEPPALREPKGFRVVAFDKAMAGIGAE